jgi:hypothetical protein
MALLKLEKGQVLHKAGVDIVGTMEVLVKGKLKISTPTTSIVLDAGGFAGLVEKPGRKYGYTYEALEESAVYSYEYTSIADIPKIVRSNPKIAPLLAAQVVSSSSDVCDVYETEYEKALMEYEKVMADYADYPELCIKVGEVKRSFAEIEEVIPPEKSGRLPQWTVDFLRSLKENEEVLRKSLYPLSMEIDVGMIMTAVTAFNAISDAVQLIMEYRKILKKKTTAFEQTVQMMRIKLNEIENPGEDGKGQVVIENALSTILAYSGASPEASIRFEELVNRFKANDNRYDSSDDARALRRSLSNAFYEIYLPIFLKSLTDENLPLEIKLFFMFGFVDEELAGAKNTTILCNMARAYTPDPQGIVVTLYEWLKKVYFLEVDPSKNEFDQDWPTYLKEQKNSGNINGAQMDAMMNNPLKRVNFEIQNFFSLANRMTFGRVSSFVPVFDQQNVLRPLDMAYQTSAKVHGYFDMIRGIDYSVFCRQAVYSNPEIGITQLYYDDDITPFMILMPNIGSRAGLWQEINGKNRRTRARMMVSIFNTENTEDAMIRLFGEFRWEMCKTVQGVHWNDVTDPSLTSMYCDYLQFFKKNPSLSQECKEKLRTDLKKFNNNYRNVFTQDYLYYIKYESSGSPRLNKVAREILFTFCPFSKEIRENKIGDNPQYADLLNHYNARIGNTAKPVLNAISRLKRDEIPVPPELTRQIEHLEK